MTKNTPFLCLLGGAAILHSIVLLPARGQGASKVTLTAKPATAGPGEKITFSLTGAPADTTFTLTFDDKSGVICPNAATAGKTQECTAPKAPSKSTVVVGEVEFTAAFTAEGKTQTVTATTLFVPADEKCVAVLAADCRENFEATFYVGASVDSFASNESKKYLGYTNPTSPAGQALAQASGPQWGYIAGIDFQYRLTHSEKSRRWPWQLWIYGETVHGQRSTEVDCAAAKTPDVCQLASGFAVADPAGSFLAILRNATSLEGYAGARLEFFKVNPKSQNSANLYVKSQLGFLTVQSNGGDVVDDHIKAALGAMMTNGKFRDSYLEAGWGRTDLFNTQRGRRFKVDGYLQYELSKTVSPFIQLVVNNDFGPGSDDVRTYYGINVDVKELFKKLGKAKDTTTPASGN